MKPKPKHLGLEYAAQFKDRSIAEDYRYRPLYPPETFEILSGLITDKPRVVLDVGCGTGYIARYLIKLVDRIDAIDFSRHMIEKGRNLPNGSHPNINWICSSVEEAAFLPPYALITAGQSLHWLEWNMVFQRFKEALTPKGYLALINYRFPLKTPWNDELTRILGRFSTNQDFQPYDLVEELENRGLFQKHGEKQTPPISLRQAVDEYIKSLHSSNGFSRERMGKEKSEAFDDEVKQLVSKHCPGREFETQITAEIVWGKPKPSS
ncbi:MAG: class I SAM-dependent methyltransferase [Planctomycetota bacterium]